MMNANEMKLKELIYQLMNGAMISEMIPNDLKNVIENEFEAGKICEEAYQHIYDANRHICERFHVQEDMDVECILTNYSLITRTMCMKMYDYGSLYLRDEYLQKFIIFYKTLSDSKKEEFIKRINETICTFV